MKKWIPEIVIILTAAVLRTAGLLSAVPGMSEARIRIFSSQTNSEIWRLYSIGADKYFGGTILCIYLNKVLGMLGGPAAMRLFCAMAGILSVAIFYFMARRIFGASAARFAGFFLAVAPAHIIISRSISPSSVSFLLTILALFYFYKFYEGTITGSEKAFFALSIIAGCFYNYMTLFLIIPVNIIFFGFMKKEEKDFYWWIPLQALLCFALWLWWKKWTAGYFSLSTSPTFTGDMSAQGHIVKEGLFNLQVKLLFIEKYINFIYNIGGYYPGAGLANGWSIFGIVLIPIVYHYFPFLGFREYEGGYKKRLFIFFFASVFISVATVFSFLNESLPYVLLPAACMLFLIMGHGASKFGSLKSKALISLMIVTVLFGFAVPSLKMEKQRPNWDAAAEVVSGKMGQGAPIVFIDGWMDAPFLVTHPDLAGRTSGFFSNFDMEFLMAGQMRQDEILPFFNGKVDSYPPYQLAKLLTDNPEVWIVRSVATGVEKTKHVLEYINWMKGNTELIYEEDLGGDVAISLVRFKPNTSAPKTTYF